MSKVLINDTADVVFKRKSDGHVVFTAEAQLASISQSVSEEKLKGGIGNRTIALLRSDKEVTLQVRNALFDLEWLSMTQGVAIEQGTVKVWKREDDLTVESGTVTIKGTPIDDEVKVINAANDSEDTTATGKDVTVSTSLAKDGDKVSVLYKQEVTGNIVAMDAKKFSETYEVEYSTIAYDPETNEVIKDIYFQFDQLLVVTAR